VLQKLIYHPTSNDNYRATLYGSVVYGVIIHNMSDAGHKAEFYKDNYYYYYYYKICIAQKFKHARFGGAGVAVW